MKRVVKQVLFVWIAFASVLLSGGLLKGEHQFRALKSYKIHDFHFAKPIVYMDIVTSLFRDGEKREILTIWHMLS